MLFYFLLVPACFILVPYLVIKRIQSQVLKKLKILEFRHPLYPKKYGIVHHFHFSEGRSSGKNLDFEFILDFMQKNHPNENQVLLWGSPVTPFILTYGGEPLKKIMTDTSMEKTKAMRVFRVDKSLVTCPMKEHRQIRKIAQPAFNKNSLIAFNHTASHHLKIFLKKLSEQISSQAVDLQKLTHLLFLDITCDTSLGENLQAQNFNKKGEIHPLVENLEIWENSSNDLASFTRIKIPFVFLFDSLFNQLEYFLRIFAPNMKQKRDSALKFVRDYVKTVTQRKVQEFKTQVESPENENLSHSFRANRIKETSLIDQLMTSYISGEIDDQTVSDQILAFVLAGTDTTAYTLSAGIHHLGNNASLSDSKRASLTCFLEMRSLALQNELREEVNSILPDNLKFSDLENFNLEIDEFTKFPKVRAFMKECLRFYNPVPFIIKSYNLQLSGWSIFSKLDCPVFICPNLIHRDIRFWKSPEKFDIARWLDSKSETCHISTDKSMKTSSENVLPTGNPTLISNEYVYTYIPFSAGKRNCIGQNFAVNNLMLSFIYLLKFYSFKSVTERLEVNDQVVYSALNCFIQFSLNH